MLCPASISFFPAAALFLASSLAGQDQKAEAPFVAVPEILGMSPERIDSEPDVRTKGVITFFDDIERLAFIQNDGAGLFFYPGNEFTGGDILHLKSGDLVELEGIVMKGNFAPVLSEPPEGWLAGVRLLGRGAFPEPVHLPTHRLHDSEYHNRYVSLAAVIRTISRKPDTQRIILGLSTPDGMLEGVIPHNDENTPLPLGWKDLPVVLHGVVSGYGDESARISGRSTAVLYVPSPEHVFPQRDAIEEVFASPARPLSSLVEFDPENSAEKRILVKGVVTLQLPGEGVFLHDDGSGLWVGSYQDLRAEPGDRLAAAGLLTHSGDGWPLFEDAVLRKQGRTKPPAPVAATVETLTSGSNHADLVELEAEVVSVVPGATDHPTIVLEAEGHQFRVNPAPTIKLANHPEPGSLVRVAGICLAGAPGKGTPGGGDGNFSLILRSSDDLTLLRSPPWWTQRRLLVLLASLLAIILGHSIWIRMLHQRVAERTTLIRKSHEHKVVWEERNRIARELHDTMEQQLLGITLQLESATSRLATAPAQAAASLRQMGEMIRHSREEARRSVWDLRSRTLECTGLAEALREIAVSLEVTGHRSLTVTVRGTERRLNRKTEFHLMRIAQEAMTNSIKHGNASDIEVVLSYGNDSVLLEVRDNGKGFDNSTLQHGGHFGILGMRERAAKLLSEIRITSIPGEGCLMSLEVKLALEPLPVESL